MFNFGDYEGKELKERLIKVYEWLQDREHALFVILYMAMPFVVNFIIDCLSRRSLTAGIVFYFSHPFRFWCNALIIMLTVSVTMLFRKRAFWATLIYLVWIVFGIINCVVLINRVTPFAAVDFKLIDDCLAVINQYINVLGFIAIGIGAVLVIAFLVFLWLKTGKSSRRMNLLSALGIIFLIVVACMVSLHIGKETKVLEIQFGELSQSYLRNGFVYCFSNSVVNTGVPKPHDYSPEKIDELIKNEGEDMPEEPTLETEEPSPEDMNQVKTPNIIVVQLESFFDITDVLDMTFTSDPIPNFHALMDEFDSGYLSMPCVGAGTANSEFEVLTGMNLDDFGPGEYPYKTVMRSTTCESSAYNLKEFGYTAHALHNNTGQFYGRNVVFSNLGFDTFTSIEYMNLSEEDYTPTGWAKDYVLADEIMQILDSTKDQDFVFTISVQGHGSYPTGLDYEKKIETVDIGNEAIREATDYYINQIYEMDEFVGSLVNMLSNYKEDTILVMYGDHLPSLGFSDEEVASGSVYNTVYFIWNNMGLVYGDEDLEAYQLMAKVLQSLGIDKGVINKYHQQNRGSEEYLNGLQNLEYDILYGGKICYDGVNPYNSTKLQMGIREIKVTDVYVDLANEEIENCVVIKGENFTPYSEVYVNEEAYETIFVDENTLWISDQDLSGFDSFVVWQSSLSSTDEFLYYGASSEQLQKSLEEEPETQVSEEGGAQTE